MCVWEGVRENRLTQSRVDLILGLMHLYRVLLVLFALLGSGCMVLCSFCWLVLSSGTSMYTCVELHVHYMYVQYKCHTAPIQSSQCS